MLENVLYWMEIWNFIILLWTDELKHVNILSKNEWSYKLGFEFDILNQIW